MHTERTAGAIVIEPSRTGGGTVRLVVAGELDIAAVLPLRAALHLAELERPERVVLDLRGVSFVDSTGLGVLVAADRRARAGGWVLELAPGDGPVRRLLELTMLTGHFSVAAA